MEVAIQGMKAIDMLRVLFILNERRTDVAAITALPRLSGPIESQRKLMSGCQSISELVKAICLDGTGPADPVAAVAPLIATGVVQLPQVQVRHRAQFAADLGVASPADQFGDHATFHDEALSVWAFQAFHEALSQEIVETVELLADVLICFDKLLHTVVYMVRAIGISDLLTDFTSLREVGTLLKVLVHITEEDLSSAAQFAYVLLERTAGEVLLGLLKG